MNTSNTHNISEKQHRHRNQMAAALSIVPGLGHVYKGHTGLGISLLLLSLSFIWIGLISAFATLGISLSVPFFYVGATAWHAYMIEDHRKHHMGIF